MPKTVKKEQKSKSVLASVKEEKEQPKEQKIEQIKEEKVRKIVEVRKPMGQDKDKTIVIPDLNIRLKKDESGKLRLGELEMLRLKNQVLEKKSKIGVTPKSTDAVAKKKRAKAIGRKRKISAALGKLQNTIANMPTYETLLQEHLKDKLKVKQRYEIKNSNPKSGVNRKRKISMYRALSLKEPIYPDDSGI